MIGDVGPRSIAVVLILAVPATAREPGFDFRLWDEMTHRYVDAEGRVDYDRLRAAPADLQKLARLSDQIAAQDLAALSTVAAKEAFYLDAYNVLVWKNVIDHRTKSVADGNFSFFEREYVVAGRKLSLKRLEDDVIRPTFRDARLHMALNCASGGCPTLPQEAFTPERVGEQLDREARRFCNEPRNVSYDPVTRIARLSRLFDWYAADFGHQALAFINQRRAPPLRIPPDAKIELVDYDWRLNDPSLRR
jgi:hypothetical protein